MFSLSVHVVFLYKEINSKGEKKRHELIFICTNVDMFIVHRGSINSWVVQKIIELF